MVYYYISMLAHLAHNIDLNVIVAPNEPIRFHKDTGS